MKKTMRRILSVVALVAVLSVSSLAATKATATLSSNGSKTIFSKKMMYEGDYVRIMQTASYTASDDDYPVKWVLSNSNGVGMTFEYLYGTDSVTLYSSADTKATLTAYNDGDEALTFSYSYTVYAS